MSDIKTRPEKNEEKYLECGQIINTHGIAGTVKIDPWTDTPQDFAELRRLYFRSGSGFEERKILKNSVQKRFVLSKIEGVDTVEAAEALKGTVVFADRDDIPLDEGSYFIVDLIGLPVIDSSTGVKYGEISEVFNAGASDIYTVATPSGERMMPAVPEYVDRVEPGEAVYVSPIEGMFD
ncbi:MAG: ribosome maturation factor RimM [Clostridia bacterium]|nr:ribosome maturation factor RimM [Clostridia bacterium]